MKKRLSVLVLIIFITISLLALGACNSDRVVIDGVVYQIYAEHAVVIGYKGKSKEVTILDIVEGRDVDMIDGNVFKDTDIVTIDLSDKLTSIGDEAFKNCTQLTDIDFKNVDVIGSYAFKNCTKLRNLEFNAYVKIFNSFENCSSLETVVFNNSAAVTIGSFKNCTSLHTVNLTSGIIHNNAFEGCVSLSKVYIPKGITRVEKDAFLDCGVDLYFEVDTPLEGYAESFNGVNNTYWGISKEDFDSLED